MEALAKGTLEIDLIMDLKLKKLELDNKLQELKTSTETATCTSCSTCNGVAWSLNYPLCWAGVGAWPWTPPSFLLTISLTPAPSQMCAGTHVWSRPEVS